VYPYNMPPQELSPEFIQRLDEFEPSVGSLAVHEDPTRTVALRKRFQGFFRGMWSRISGGVRQFVRDFSRLPPTDVFEPVCRGWVRAQFRDALSGGGRTAESFLRSGYQRGLRQSATDLRRIGVEPIPGDPDALLNRPAFAKDFRSIRDQYYRSLDGIEDNAIASGLAVYTAGIRNEDTKAQVMQAISGSLRTGQNATDRVARTSIVDSFNSALLTRYESEGIETVGAVIELKFTTAGDQRVCQRCRALERRDTGQGRGVFTIREARGVIPVHDGCRCRWVPLS